MAYTEFDINKVYLMLGPGCNYQCRHCIQADGAFTLADVSPKSMEYIQHLAKIRPPQIKRLTVMFWGGEPLLYMDVIKTVIDELRDSVDYAMVSNGALLDAATVDFINAHNIHYALSNDGPNTTLVRGENLLENDQFIELFKKIGHKEIDAVITAYNQDYYALWDYIESKIPGIHITTEFLQCTWDMPEDLYAFDVEAYKEMMGRIVKKAHDDTLEGNDSREVRLLQSYRDDIMKFVRKMDKGEITGALFPRCGQMRRCVNMDLSGNVYACHNFSNKIGTVEEDYDALLTRYDAWYADAQDMTCLHCPYIIFCRGGCPYVKPSAGKFHCCEIVGAFISGCLDYVTSFSHTFEDVEL